MEAIDAAIFVGYLVALLGIGLWVSKRSKSFSEFTVAGRSLKYPQLTATMVATFYGATALLGVAGLAYSSGVGAIWFCAPFYVGNLLVAFFLVKRISKFAKFTMPEAIGSMFDRKCRILSSSLLIFYCLIPEAIIALGLISNSMLGIPVELGMVLATSVIIVYTLLGGLRAIVRTDVLQFFIMGAGMAILVLVGLETLGGIGGVWQAVPADLKTITGGIPITDIIVYSITLSTLPLVSAQLYQRFFSSSSWKISRRALLTAVACWVVFDIAIIAAGMMAHVNNPPATEAEYMTLSETALPDLGMAILPIGIRGFFMAALLAAVMSTADSYLHVAASSFSNDIFRFTGKRKNERQMLWAAKISVVVFGLFSLVLALWLQTIVAAIVFLLMVWVSGMLLPVILSYKFKLSARTAFAGMLAGAGTSIAWNFVYTYAAVPYYAHPLFFGIGACLLTLVVVNRFWR